MTFLPIGEGESVRQGGRQDRRAASAPGRLGRLAWTPFLARAEVQARNPGRPARLRRAAPDAHLRYTTPRRMPVTTSPAPAVSRGQLLAVLGVGFGLAVTIGNAVGAGILRTPGVIATHLQTFWPFMAVWVVGAIYALLGANALSEL